MRQKRSSHTIGCIEFSTVVLLWLLVWSDFTDSAQESMLNEGWPPCKQVDPLVCVFFWVLELIFEKQGVQLAAHVVDCS